MSMELCFLGTSSAQPTTTRNVSSHLLSWPNGAIWIFDAGEGTQRQLMRSPYKPGRVDRVFITHLHGDHVNGLPGLLILLSNQRAETADPIEVVGPRGTKKFLRDNFESTVTFLGARYHITELLEESEVGEEVAEGTPHADEIVMDPIVKVGKEWTVAVTDEYKVVAASLDHRVPSIGYVVTEADKPGKLDMSVVAELGVPRGPLLGQLKKGNSVTLDDGTVVTPEQCVGPPQPGKIIVCLGDTCNSEDIADAAQGASIIVHEATHENALEEKARETGHSTAGMAGEFAKQIGAKALVLTHFSNRYVDDTRPDYEEPAGPSSGAAKDGVMVSTMVEQAKEAFGSDAVTAAYDFIVIPVP